ncbi:MAG: hypothetical protein OXE58_04685 [Acidobacteria bacterium]|nr:hypothetical protein [Acidobacteriota bacterium]
MPHPSDTFFDPVDPAVLSRQLDPRELGRHAGELGRPPLDAANDPEEARITANIEGRIQDAAARFGELRRQAQSDFEQTEEFSRYGPVDIHASRARAEAELDGIRQTRRLALHEASFERTKRKEDLADFRQRNRLRREPSYPTGLKKTFMWALAFGVLGIEALLNGSFLAVGQETGLVGGVSVAVVVALLNVLPAFWLFGPFSRHLHHVNVWWQALALLLVATYGALLLVLNLAVAHYRELSGALAANIESEVVDRMLTDPFGLVDAQSWLLFGMGLFFSLIAFADGYKLDDAYPEYGKRHLAMIQARERYERKVEEVAEEMGQAKSRSLDEIKRIVFDFKRAPAERARIAKRVGELIAAFDHHAESLNEVGQMLVRDYRAANREARPDSGIPACHARPWGLLVPEIDRSLYQNSAPTLESAPMEQAFQQAHEAILGRHEEVCTELFEPGRTRAAGRPIPAGADADPTQELPVGSRLSAP